LNADRRGCPHLKDQLHQLLTRPVDTVVCTLLDESPEAPMNSALAHHDPAKLLAGIWLLGELTGAKNRWIVAEGGTPFRWLAEVREGAAQLKLRMIWLRNDYPQSDPSVLLHTLLNRKLRPKRLPTEQGVLLLDAAAAIDIGQIALCNKPVERTPLAFRDHTAGVSRFVTVPTGMKISEALAAAGVATEGKELRQGDLLRDLRIDGNATAGSGELVVHVNPREPARSPDSCVRCGWCVEGCPTRIQPAGLLEAAQRRNPDLADHYGLDSCIECGICTYVCPSHLPILDGIRQIRQQSDELNKQLSGTVEKTG
jgi:electron transport complex protein RnfC